MKKILWSWYLAYLKFAAKIQLQKIKPKYIVGITGSAGKSSCREAVAAVLKESFRVKSGKKSLNSEIGVPLDVLGFNENYSNLALYHLRVSILVPFKLLFDWPKADVYVCEMGVDKPGDMDYLLSFIHPNIAVMLNILPVHTANFPAKSEAESLKLIAAEKGKIISSFPSDGWAVLNVDDSNVSRYKIPNARYKIITFGNGGEIKPLHLELPGYLLTEDYGYTLAAAVAVGKILGIGEQESRNNLIKNLKLPPGRMSVFPGIGGSTIIDSTYNASPATMITALKELKKFPGKRKIAVLGDMRELGEWEKDAHEKVSKEAISDADLIFTYGPLTEKYFPENGKIKKFRRMGDLIKEVLETVQNGDVILVKGSQNTIMLETLVEKLLADPKNASLLCRRGEFWEKKREKIN